MKQKRVFIVHGWDGYPEEGWFPWLKKELEQKGFAVEVPAMPNPDEPEIDAWVQHLSKLIKKSDENTFFVGHSVGCQTILRYLETLPPNQKIGGVVCIAGWFTLENLETEEEKTIAKPWLETPIDFEKIKRHTNKFFAIFSDNDPFVPLTDKEIFEKKLSAQTLIEHQKGHFSGDEGITKLPSILEAVLKISG
jgi:hypothetical protein